MKPKGKNGFFGKLKRLIFSFSLPTLIAVALIVGSTVALLVSDSVQKQNVFVPGVVDCEVDETFDGIQKTSIRIQNTGNTPAYIRVNFASYMQNTAGVVVGQTATVPDITLATGWVYGADGYYYYKYPVAPGAYTGEMLGAPIVLKQNKDADGNVVSNQVIEVFAGAVQAYPSDAVVQSWDTVAAVTGDDDHLVIKIKHYDNYLSGANYGAKYRGYLYYDTDKEATGWKVYHTGIFNDGIISADNFITMTSDASGVITLSLYYVNIIELEKFALYFADDTNLASVTLYADDIEQMAPTDAYKLGVMTKSSVSGDYVSDVAEHMAMEYSMEVLGTNNRQFTTIVIKTNGPSQTVKLSEIRAMGYMGHSNIAPAAEYKGAADTQSVAIVDGDTGADYTSWTEYHAGRLNDTTRNSAVYDEKPLEKVMVQSADSTTDTIRIIYKLSKPALIDLVEMYIGALNLYGDPDDGKESVVYADNVVREFNVYVSETEDASDWKLLGSDTSGTVDGEVFMKVYAAGDTEQFGQYVIIEVKGTPGQMFYGFNEAQIWSNATLALDE